MVQQKHSDYHYRLFITTNHNLELTSRHDRRDFPLHLTTVSNLALSLDALEQQLDSEILYLRWPQFEPQRKILESDKIFLLNKLAEIKDDLLGKVS